MKKLFFPLAVILLIGMIGGLIGLNAYQNKQTKNVVENAEPPSQTTSTTEISDPNAPVIYCIGDSLTVDTDVKSYASYLKDLTGLETKTIGGMQDTTMDMAVRTGAVAIYANNVTIPAERESIEITLYNAEHETLDVLHHEGTNFKTVSIGGIEGTLAYDENKKTHTFTRSQSGEMLTISDYTQITSDVPAIKENDIIVLFSGTYDPNVYMGIFDTINDQYRILNGINSKQYIVVSLTSRRTFEIVNDMNKVLSENFNEHYLDFRSYIMENGLNAAEIEATEQDQVDLSNRYIPSSLLQKDKIDGNELFNELLAKQLIVKMQELSYITEE